MRIDIGGLKLFVDVDGFALRPDGRRMKELPVLVLVHGGPGFDHTIQKSFAPRLAEFAQVVCYDQRGHGRSDAGAEESWTLNDWADDIVRLCNALGIAHPIVLGSSFGGMVAQAYAIRHADHPSKLLLHCTAPRLSLERIVAKFQALGGEEAAEVARALWEDPGDPVRFGPYAEICMPLYNVHRRDPRVVKDWGIATRGPLTHFYRAGGEGHRFDLRAQLNRIACPTLIMAGEEDPICPVEDSEDLVAALPPHLVHFRRFAGCGHGINWDDAEGFIAAIREFVGS